MVVLPFTLLRTLDRLPRSDVAITQEMLQLFSSDEMVGVFVSQDWWVHGEGRALGTPDYEEGERANLKFSVLCSGLVSLIERHGLDESKVVVWMDWWSIDQDSAVRKLRGIRSLVHYAQSCEFMLVPVRTPFPRREDGSAAEYPDQIEHYGRRSWCRAELFVHFLLSEMRNVHDGSESAARLYAVGTDHRIVPFTSVEFTSDGDLPSQGLLSCEDDRPLIVSIEEQMISAFGHAVVRARCAGWPPIIDLSSKMLRDEHVATLTEAVRSGALDRTLELHLNWNPQLSRLPNLGSLSKLRKLSLAGCDALVRVPRVHRDVVIRPAHLALHTRATEPLAG